MEIVVQIDEHIAARHILAVFKLDGDENRSEQSYRQRENAY